MTGGLAQQARVLDAAIADLTRPAPGTATEWLERNAATIRSAYLDMLAENDAAEPENGE